MDELKRKLFGTSSEKGPFAGKEQDPADESGTETETTVKGHTRKRKKKSVRDDLYEALLVVEVPCNVSDAERFCPDCNTPMKHLGYKFAREELRIIPVKVIKVRYM